MRRAVLFAVGVVIVSACSEPFGVAGARRHLGERAGPRQTVFAVPLLVDTLEVRELLGDSSIDTTGLLLALSIAPETLQVGLGDKLQFDSIGFDPFVYDFSDILVTKELSISTDTLSGPFGAPPLAGARNMAADTAEFVTPNGSQVLAATVAGGFAVLTITSSLNVAAKVTVLIRDQTGLIGSVGPITVPLSGGGTTISVDSANLAGVRLTQFATMSVSVQPLGFGGGAPAGSIHAVTTFRRLRLQSVTLAKVNETFDTEYAVLGGEPRLLALDTLVTRSGSLNLTIANRLPVALNFSITLGGTKGAGGAPLTGTLTVPAAPGDGSAMTGSVVFNLGGVTLLPESVVARVTGSVTADGPVVITSALTSAAVEVSGMAGLAVERLSGRLDPASTPELNVALEQYSEIDRSGFDFGDLEEAVTAFGFNDVTATVRVASGAGTPLLLRDAFLRLVRLDAAGQPARDGAGNLDFERDSTGAVLSAPLASPGQATLAIGRGTPGAPATATVAVQMGPIVTRIVRLLFGATPVRAAVVAVGTAEAGDGAPSTIRYADSVQVDVALSARLDLTLPDTGIVITIVDTTDGAGLEPADSADIVGLLDTASVTFTVTNGAPFRLVVTPAFRGGEHAEVFNQGGVVQLEDLALPAAQVNPDGTGGVAATGTIVARIVRLTAGALLGERVTVGIRLRLMPGNAANPRAALRPGDVIRVSGSARVVVSTGTPTP